MSGIGFRYTGDAYQDMPVLVTQTYTHAKLSSDQPFLAIPQMVTEQVIAQ